MQYPLDFQGNFKSYVVDLIFALSVFVELGTKHTNNCSQMSVTTRVDCFSWCAPCS